MKKINKSSLISTIIITYFIIGFAVAILFAIYYRWHFLSFLSPGFYSVILTWPYQLIGFASDFFIYGLAGKSVGL